MVLVTRSIAIVLCLAAVALVYEAWHVGTTLDEPSHIAAARAYWAGEDVLLPTDTPPLTRLISGWVAVAMGVPEPRKSEHWTSQDTYLIGPDILGKSGKPRQIVVWSRMVFVVFPLVLIYLVWRWGSECFSPTVALLLAVCVAADPGLLAHGALVKSDVPATAMAVWFAYALSRYWKRPSFISLAHLTLALTAAVATKFTLLALVGVALIAILLKGERRIMSLMVLCAGVYAGIVALDQFQFLPGTLLPRNYASGFQFIQGVQQTTGFSGYMLGRRLEGFEPWYFPLTFALKIPIALQALTLLGLGYALWKRRATADQAIILTCGWLFFAMACASNYHIGVRHIFPALPFFVLSAGFALRDKWKPAAIAAAWVIAASAFIYPNGISYFNEWIGGPGNGWHYLADSNLDWGQNYPELAAYLNREKPKSFTAFLTSADFLAQYMEAEVELKLGPYPDAQQPRFHPAPGLYAVTVNYLTGVLYPPEYENFLADFRAMHPVARAGYSIHIYQVK